MEERLLFNTQLRHHSCTPYLANVVRCKTRLLEDGFDWLDAFVEERRAEQLKSSSERKNRGRDEGHKYPRYQNPDDVFGRHLTTFPLILLLSLFHLVFIR